MTSYWHRAAYMLISMKRNFAKSMNLIAKVRGLLFFLCSAYLLSLTSYLILRLFFGDRFWWLALINVVMFWTFLPLMVGVPLVILLRSRWLIGLALILSLVWIIQFGRFFIPKNHPLPTGQQLK